MADQKSGAGHSKDPGGNEIPEISGKDSKGDQKLGPMQKAEDALKRLQLQGILPGGGKKDMTSHKFWQTQPVPTYDQKGNESEDGPISPEDPTKVPQAPSPLPEGFEWVTMNLDDEAEIEEVYQLLYYNYVEDDEAMFRFKYSSPFLNWALKAPGWRKEWHVGVRATQSRKLVAFISGVPCTLRVRSKIVPCSEVNFLCVHKKLRNKRLAPVLIREITRQCNLQNIWQAVYTGGALLPTPVATCRYYHRSLDWPKLYEVGFSPLPPFSTKEKQIAKYKLPENTVVKGLRPMTNDDVPAVQSLVKRYLDRTDIAQEFTEDEVRHWLLNYGNTSKEQVVYAYVVEKEGQITDFFSFYTLESSVIRSQKYDSIRAAYLFYYATDAAFNAKDRAGFKKRLNELMMDALILAKQANFDVFNALTLLDDALFLDEQKFGAGDGRLHYYLFNYRTAPIAGGIDSMNKLDQKNLSGVGLVML